VPATNYGFHYDLDDSLQIVEVPHVWLTKPKDKRTHITDLLPELGQRYLFNRGDYTVHNRAYLSDNAHHPSNN
jgi:hypothetical protein